MRKENNQFPLVSSSKTNKQSTIVAYARTNSSEVRKTSNGSIDIQLSSIKSWARSNGHKITSCYSDNAVSGLDPHPPQLFKLIEDIENKIMTVNAIAVTEASRLTRCIKTWMILETKLRKLGVFVFTLESEIDQYSSQGFKRCTMKIHELLETSLRMNTNPIEGIETSSYYNSITPPFGYKLLDVSDVKPKNEHLDFEKEPEEAKVVELIFMLAHSGQNASPYGAKQITNHLNEKNITCREKLWTLNRVHKILTNQLYVGEGYYGAKKIAKGKGDATNKIRVPPLVSEKDFLKVKETIISRNPASKSLTTYNKSMRLPTGNPMITFTNKTGYRQTIFRPLCDNNKQRLAPFGFRFKNSEHVESGDQNNDELLINKQEAGIIKLIFALLVIMPPYAKTAIEIALFLNQSEKFRRSREWTEELVLSALTNSIYCGVRHIGSKKISPRKYDLLIEVPCPKIITKELFLKAKIILDQTYKQGVL